MAPASRPEGGSSRKSLQRQQHSKSQSQSQDSQNLPGSPSSKSYGSSRTSGGGGGGNRDRHRRRRSSPTAKSALRETLSSFGDDVIRMKHYPKQYGYDNHGYFQPDLPFGSSSFDRERKKRKDSSADSGESTTTPSVLEKGVVENELATILSVHDPNFQTKRFERVNPSEVGVRSSKWQKLFQASSSTSRFQKLRRISKRNGRGRDTDEWPESYSDSRTYFAQFYDEDGRLDLSPPYWGVSRQTRDKISMLGLSLILHELACFTSCVLLGCTLFQGMEAVSWVQQKPFTENWTFFKWYSSFQTLLVVITSVGFLNRVDTTERRSLWIFPLFLIPVLCLSISDYCNKAWELQRLECVNYHRLDELSKVKVHLSQDCSTVLSALQNAASQINSPGSGTIRSTTEKVAPLLATALAKPVTELDTRGVAPFIMRVISALSTLIISTYLFCCRKSYFLVDLFGPPDELKGFMKGGGGDKADYKSFSGLGGAGGGDAHSRAGEDDRGVEVIFQRGMRHNPI